MPGADPAGVAALELRAGRYLRWAVFLLGCMFAIMVVDLQLKRSVADQAAEASLMLAEWRDRMQA